jgi:glycerol dehydrogenase
MNKVLVSPLRYSQGPGATSGLATEMLGLGLSGPICIVASRSAQRELESIWASTFQAAGLAYTVHPFGGECSRSEIARGRMAAEACGAQVIVAAGGGKALDTGRAIAAELGIAAVCCPTIASTDAPCSAISAVYFDDGLFETYLFHPHNPSLVLVDSEVIARAPARLLVAGMGDALSTWFEARACLRSGARNSRNGVATGAGMAIAELCWRVLQEDGVEALAALKTPTATPTPALERIIEANTLLSGIGFESAGLAAAHAIHNGLTIAPEVHAFHHGEKVAFGTLAQLMLEDAPQDEIDAVLHFCISVGLPVKLADIGLPDASDALLLRIGERSTIATETIHNEPFPVTAQAVVHAIKRADDAGCRATR